MPGWRYQQGGKEMTKSYDILIVGIGGQGTILASNILGEACLSEGRHVRGAETHGMAQRGGSVETHIRIDGDFGPLIVPGTADLLLSFDLLEALRYSHYLKTGGKMVVNRQMVLPTSAFTLKIPPPTVETILAGLERFDPCLIDAEKLAAEAGSILAQNVVILGAASWSIPLQADSLISAIRKLVPQKTVDTNVSAFEKGRAFGRTC